MVNTIYLVRHGQTYWNAAEKEKHQTHSDGKGNLLTELGIRQVELTAEILKNEKIGYAFHSPLKRSKQTLGIILHYHPNVKVVEDPRTTEISMSFLDGMHQNEWEERFPETKLLYEARKKNKFGCELPKDVDFSRCCEEAKRIAERNGERNKIIPKWENYLRGMERIKPFLDEIKGLDGNILICGHQQINRVIISSLLKRTKYIKDINSIAYLETPNDVVFKIDYIKEEYKISYNKGNGWIKGLAL